MNILEQLNDEMADVVEGVSRSLVQVSNGGYSGGAGIVATADGLILTNAHVVRSRHVQVTLPDGRSYPGEYVARAADYDLAAVRVDAEDLVAVPFGNSQSLRPGDWVFAVGHPWGVLNAVTSGIVIASGANLPEMPRGSKEWVATSLHLRPGNSGGPLVDINGGVVGINTVMAGPEVGLAIPSHVAERFLEKI